MQPQKDIYDFGEKEQTWSQIRQVIRLSEKVKLEAENVIESFLHEIKSKEDDKEFNPPHSSYKIACGNYNIKWQAYWDFARLAAVTQFGGGFGTFNEEGKQYAASLIEQIFNDKDKTEQFWSHEGITAENLIEGKNIAWLFHRTLLLDSMVKFSQNNKSAVEQIYNRLFKNKRIINKNSRIIDGPICKVSKNLRNRFKTHNHSKESLTADQGEMLKFTRQYNILKLAERIRSSKIESFEMNGEENICQIQHKKDRRGKQDCCYRCDEDLDEDFPFQEIERALTRGNNSAPPFRVALLLRLLGGRYINGLFSSNPRWTLSFREGVRYVLEYQSADTDACWHDVRELREEAYDLWVHPYIPLLCLLDLGPRILLPHLPQLTTACERSLTALLTRLKYLRRKGGVLNSFKKERGAFDIVMASLSLSMAVYDRFRDLLSDSVLDDFGAEVQPHRASQTFKSAIPSTLHFDKNIKKGVVKLWNKDSNDRPGAILVFGPPGTGKTTIAKTIAQRLNEVRESEQAGRDASPWRFLEITPADFAREGSDKIVACAERIFTLLKDVRRCVVLLDEMEEFLQARTPSADKNSRLITTAFLPLLQEVVNRKESILVVATNFVGNIDPAVTRRGRFSLILPLGPPNKKTRKVWIQKNLKAWAKDSSSHRLADTVKKNKGILLEDTSLNIIAKYTMGYTHLEILTFLYEMIAEVKNTTKDLPEKKSRRLKKEDLIRTAWRIRAEQVPTALSNRAGCDWHTFANEAVRYARFTPELSESRSDKNTFERDAFIHSSDKYWNEPPLPEEAFSIE